MAAGLTLQFLAPTNVGERWLGEAETERGISTTTATQLQ
ncbi:hypothetical protein MEA186_03064 [Mesorhizobium amorphae CCNWGS0123]|uniref:Uncharacterized protein n=1 Tax=Mesorhizobium amorphae CCNWGS0123 TaxID=1082933 RepID=G6Y3W0_9HYPH|nr:hypothetical protein MEA186_03064 [Mesorhizobium amorphae CCNWGS0123]